LIGRVNQQLLRRSVQLIRGARHGGMILMVDATEASSLNRPGELRGMRLKYRFDPEEPTRRYNALLLEILRTLAAGSSKASVDWSDFAGDPSPELERLEQAVFELSRLIANLTAIDGALILDKRFGLLGFGAEVSAELPPPSQIWRALDAEAEQLVADDIEN